MFVPKLIPCDAVPNKKLNPGEVPHLFKAKDIPMLFVEKKIPEIQPILL